MTTWLLMNLCFSVIVLGALPLLRGSPARLSFALTVAALACWCLPLKPQAPRLIPAAIYRADVIPISAPALNTLANDVTDLPAPHQTVPWATLFRWALGVGLLSFALTLGRALTAQRRLIRQSEPFVEWASAGGTPIHLVDGNVAMTVGFFRPVLCIGRDWTNQPQLATVLAHERIHAARYDNLWLLGIALVRHLMWFNPLVIVLAAKARTLLEMCCDEAAAKALGSRQYVGDLSTIALNQHQAVSMASSILSSGKTSITRIQHLTGDIQMKRKHWAVLLTVTLISAAVLVQAETRTVYQQSSRTSLTIEDSGSMLLELDNAHLGEAFQKIASLGKVHVIAHPGVNQWRVSTTIRGSIDKWRDSIDALHQADPNFHQSYGYLIDGDQLYLAPQDQLSPEDRNWLDQAYVGRRTGTEVGPVFTKILVDINVSVKGEQVQRKNLLLSNENWFGFRQSGLEVSLKPTLLSNDQVHLDVRIDDLAEQTRLASPSLATQFGKMAVIEMGANANTIKIVVTPRST